ncbi:hypothetical protein V1515DRAFT_609077 [Lipomyces mesembrius]
MTIKYTGNRVDSHMNERALLYCFIVEGLGQVLPIRSLNYMSLAHLHSFTWYLTLSIECIMNLHLLSKYLARIFRGAFIYNTVSWSFCLIIRLISHVLSGESQYKSSSVDSGMVVHIILCTGCTIGYGFDVLGSEYGQRALLPPDDRNMNWRRIRTRLPL